MRQSIVIAMPPSWDLASINTCLDDCADLKPLGLRVFDEQIEVCSQEGTRVVVEEMPDQDPETGNDNKEELISDPGLDAQFRDDIAGLRLFAVDYKDIGVARRVLRCLMETVVSMGGTAWIDTPGGTSARDFLRKTDLDPEWDWRERTSDGK